MAPVHHAPAPIAGPTPAGRSRRLAASGAVLVLLAAGSISGSDDDFPFGPLRMYATSTDPSGRVAVTAVYGTTADGDDVKISADVLGMRDAELEGQLPELIADPELLGALARSYHEHHPDRPRLAQIRLQRDAQELDDGRVVRRRSTVVAAWDLR